MDILFDKLARAVILTWLLAGNTSATALSYVNDVTLIDHCLKSIYVLLSIH